jgi:tRNA-dihydrouridine synthase A
MRIGVLDGGAGARERVQGFDAADEEALQGFVAAIVSAGCERIIVHARKAVLGGLSPEENREVPPLHYDVVRALKARWPSLPLVLNGGLRNAQAARDALCWCDGVMLGREAYHRPYLLAELEQSLGDSEFVPPSPAEALERMAHYAEHALASGERLSGIVRHLLGLLAGQPGARELRRELSEGARSADAGAELLLRVAARCRDARIARPPGATAVVALTAADTCPSKPGMQ